MLLNKTPEACKHYVYRDIGMIKGYKLTNETNENDSIIINHIRIEINLESDIGREFYETIRDKFTPESLSPKYATQANYVYSERQSDDIIHIEIKILTDKSNPKEVKAKKKLLCKINKYT